MIRIYIFLIVSILFVTCSPKNLSGIYSSISEEGVLMEGYTFDFYANGTFDMKYWSDDISSNRQGRGTYSTSKGSLLLSFGIPEITNSRYTMSSLPSDKDNWLPLIFSIQDYSGSPLGGVNIIIRDSGGEMVANGITNMSGTSIVRVPQTDIPKTIFITYTGMEKLLIPLPDGGSKSFEVVLVNRTGYIPNGEKRSYRYKVSGDYLKLKDEKRTYVLKHRTPGIIR